MTDLELWVEDDSDEPEDPWIALEDETADIELNLMYLAEKGNTHD